jgi:hypothetical protein
VLIAKKLLLTELPLPARQKLMERQPCAASSACSITSWSCQYDSCIRRR